MRIEIKTVPAIQEIVERKIEEEQTEKKSKKVTKRKKIRTESEE